MRNSPITCQACAACASLNRFMKPATVMDSGPWLAPVSVVSDQFAFTERRPAIPVSSPSSIRFRSNSDTVRRMAFTRCSDDSACCYCCIRPHHKMLRAKYYFNYQQNEYVLRHDAPYLHYTPSLLLLLLLLYDASLGPPLAANCCHIIMFYGPLWSELNYMNE